MRSRRSRDEVISHRAEHRREAGIFRNASLDEQDPLILDLYGLVRRPRQ